FFVIRVRVIRTAERVPQSVRAPPGQAKSGGNRIVVPKIIPASPVARSIAAVPAAISAVVIAEPILPIVASFIAMLLPVFADLIAILLPFLTLLAPVALLTGSALAVSQSILKIIATLFGRSVGQLTGPAVTQTW